jgi:hypothetical protein
LETTTHVASLTVLPLNGALSYLQPHTVRPVADQLGRQGAVEFTLKAFSPGTLRAASASDSHSR